jgi:hypothetical protein
MKESDNSKIHISSNFILTIFLIMLDTFIARTITTLQHFATNGTSSFHAGYLRFWIHSKYIILIAFALQRWLNEGASMLRYTYSACLGLRDAFNCSESDTTNRLRSGHQGIALSFLTRANTIAFTPFISVEGCHTVSSLMDTEGWFPEINATSAWSFSLSCMQWRG